MRFFLLVFLLEMWAEFDTAVQRNQMWPSNYPFRVSNSNPACSPLHPSMFTKDHLRASDIFPQMTRFEQDYSPLWGGLVSCADSTRVCFLQAADVMTWYWLGHAEPGGCKRAACSGLSSHTDVSYSSSNSHRDLRALEHPNLSTARGFKDTRRISSLSHSLEARKRNVK